MLLLSLFAFIGGFVTILSPCILPILPIVLSSAIGGKRKPFGIITGFIFSFTFFTLALTYLVNLFDLDPSFLRTLAVIVIFLFGLSLVIPWFQKKIELLFSRFASRAPSTNNQGFLGGVLVGLSIGIIWTPCVGPILASVITLALTESVTLNSVIITLAYAAGTAIPMFAILVGGRKLLDSIPGLNRNLGNIQKAFGVLMILTAIGIYFNVDRSFQAWVLNTFPQYGTGLTSIEDNDLVKQELDKLDGEQESLNKPTNNQALVDNEGVAPEIIPGGEWFNTDPLKLADLKGKVVVVDFWTYTCINCIRTLPYLNSWHEAYADDGLVIIGVHTPEFEFEKDADNLAEAIADFDIKYPVVQDNDYSTWRAYKNRYWPAKYIIDKNGLIRYHHFGEGEYDETEAIIRELLAEDGSQVTGSANAPDEGQNYARTPETYLGYGRMQYLTSKQNVIPGAAYGYSYAQPSENRFSFEGEWKVLEEYAQASEGSKLYLNFEAKDVYLVMMNTTNQSAQVEVTLDTEDGLGTDVQDGVVSIEENRLYDLVNLKSPGRHVLQIEFLDPGIQVFAFTFG